MVTAPSAIPWANPEGSIETIVVSLEDQVKEIPGMTLPAASRAEALNGWEPPFAMVAPAGSTRMEAIGSAGGGEPPPPPPQDRVKERSNTGVSFRKRKNRTFITY